MWFAFYLFDSLLFLLIAPRQVKLDFILIFIFFFDGQIVAAGKTFLHPILFVELLVFVALGAESLLFLEIATDCDYTKMQKNTTDANGALK
jgi:hypothetical protein